MLRRLGLFILTRASSLGGGGFVIVIIDVVPLALSAREISLVESQGGTNSITCCNIMSNYIAKVMDGGVQCSDSFLQLTIQ